MHHITKRQAVLATVFYALIHAGCTLLSVHKEQGDYLDPGGIGLWLVALALGLGGVAYMTAVKQFRPTVFYGYPTVISVLGLSLFAPSTFSRILTLVLVALLILAVWYQYARSAR